MNILKKIAVGYLSPSEQTAKPDAEYKKAASVMSDCRDKLIDTLNDDQKDLFEQFLNAQLGVGVLDEAEYFVFGYRLATLMMIDVMSGVDEMVF